MNIKLELLNDAISDLIKDRLWELELDANEIVNTKAIEILSEIQLIIQNESYSDYEAIEEIISFFEKHKIATSPRHDFSL